MIKKYQSPKCNPTHKDYSAAGNLPLGTRPQRKIPFVDPMHKMKAEANQ